jgi:hypothetical protein
MVARPQRPFKEFNPDTASRILGKTHTDDQMDQAAPEVGRRVTRSLAKLKARLNHAIRGNNR